MVIDTTTINVLSNFASILKKVTKEGSEVRDINVHGKYAAAFTPQLIACFFPEERFVDENEFSIPDAYPLIMSKDVLANSNFTLKQVQDTGERRISNEYGLSVKVSDIKQDPLSEERLRSLIDEPSLLCEFKTDTKSRILDLFKNEAAQMISTLDRACFRVFTDFEKPRIIRDNEDELVESDEELAQRPVKAKKIKADYSHIPLPKDATVLDEEGEALINDIRAKCFDGELENEAVKSRVPQELLNLKDTLLGGISYEVFDEKILPQLTQIIIAERRPLIEKFNDDIVLAKKQEDETVERINAENEAKYKEALAEYKEKMKAYSERLAKQNEIKRETPIIALEMKSDSSESIDYADEIADEAKIYGDTNVYMDYGVFKNLIFNDTYRIKITSKGFAIISYEGRVSELKGLHYIVSLYEKD